MTVVEEIFDEIDSEARLLNGEVVRRAFSRVECCPWFVNRLEFYGLLASYKIAKSVVKSARLRMLDPLTHEERRDPITIRQNRFAHTLECEWRENELRDRLRVIWPCKQCIGKYNPTGRKRW